GLMFAAFFMATDMVTSPVTHLGQLIFGIGCGVLTLVIRQYTPLPEGVTFAVLVMNALAPALESLTIAPIFGVGESKEARLRGVAVTTVAAVVLVGIFVVLDRNQPATVPVIRDGQYLPIAELLGDSGYEVVDHEGTRYYLVRDEDGSPAQAAFIAEQGGFNAPIRFLLVLDAEHSVHTVSILEHSEDPGLGERITRPSFLEQFVGLDKDSSFSLGAEIEAISGATISSRALASGVNKALEMFDIAFYGKEELSAFDDGTYLAQVDSFGGLMELEVVVTDGKISSVNILSHADTPGISDPAISGMPERIVAANSADVDAVSGATVTSGAIKKGVQQALAQAADSGSSPGLGLFAINVGDGVHQGSAQGFGGELVLDVTVADGKITEIVVVESSETPFVADSALKKLLPALIEAQGPVDTVSGATATSKAVHEALVDALSTKEGQ
ncbi:MAG TPA: hypothetical protein DDW87_07945, partial [Firmicutes bacterium]|nr:hypothetical protein [Bacillota bacterium]